jgi:hypothetical protein
MEDITRLFFDSNEKCPPEIPDCANLRLEYLNTLDGLKRNGGCSSCAERQLKNSFIKRIESLITK